MSQNINVFYKTKTSEFYVNKLQLPHRNTFVKKKKKVNAVVGFSIKKLSCSGI